MVPDSVNTITDSVNSFTDAVNSFTDAVNPFTDAVNPFTDAANLFTDTAKLCTDVLASFTVIELSTDQFARRALSWRSRHNSLSRRTKSDIENGVRARCKMTLVSVIIPSYNRYDHLMRCLDGVRAQQLPHGFSTEVIVVNDGSTDVRYYARHDGVTMIHLAANTARLLGFVSVGFVRNCGLRIARGIWVAFCDDDDVWLPNRLAVGLECGASASVSDARVFTDDDPPAMPADMMPRYHDRVRARYKAWFPYEFRNGFPRVLTTAMLQRHNLTIFSTLLVHRDVWRHAGVFNETRPFREFFEDWDFVKRVAACAPDGGIIMIDQPLIKYREHQS